MSIVRRLVNGLALFFVLGIFGCGGGGGGGAGTSGVGLFITDDLNNGYDSVWVAVFRIELLSQSGATTVFEDGEGRFLDVRSLNVGGQQNFAFIGEGNIPPGEYTGVRVTLLKDVVLFPTGETNGLVREFAGLDSNQMKQLTANFAAPRPINDYSNLVIDFLLQYWEDDGQFVQNAQISDGSTDPLPNPNLHIEDDFTGVVSRLEGAAPTFAFKLNTRQECKVSVLTDSSTAIFNEDGSDSATLRNGARVEVRGRYVPGERCVLATSVKVLNGELNQDFVKVKGQSFDPNPEDGTFFVRARQCEGWAPTRDSVRVRTTLDGTRYVARNGVALTQAEFFDILGKHPGIKVKAVGTLDEGDGVTLDAVRVQVLGEHDGMQVRARGDVASEDPENKAFVMTLRKWRGFPGSNGQSLLVQLDAETELVGPDGESLSFGEFFELLDVGSRVVVKGRMDEGALRADRVKVKPESNEPDEARGEVSAVFGGEGAFDLVLSNWEGFEGEPGMTVRVVTTAETRFKASNGEPISREAFFAELSPGAVLEVDGWFDGGSVTLTAFKVEWED